MLLAQHIELIATVNETMHNETLHHKLHQKWTKMGIKMRMASVSGMLMLFLGRFCTEKQGKAVSLVQIKKKLKYIQLRVTYLFSFAKIIWQPWATIAVHYCFKFQKIFLSLSRANFPILRKNQLCACLIYVCT